jgi:hypothetical protein
MDVQTEVVDVQTEVVDVEADPAYSSGQVLSTVDLPDLTEASGLAASSHPGVLWVHNDSGDSARFFAINLQGELLGQFSLEGIAAVDWEDMAAGPGPEPGVRYLYLGDIGDNSKNRPFVTIHRVREPALPEGELPSSGLISEVHSFRLQYPEGKSHDCETLMVDPLDGTVILVNKALGLSFKSSLFTVTLPTLPPEEPLTLTHLADINISLPTAGDVSPDGTRWLLRNYNKAYLWRRSLDSQGTPLTLPQTFSGMRFDVPLSPEPQGETVAFAMDGSGYYSLSEGKNQTLYFYPKEH